VVLGVLCLAKHSLQYTGLPAVGLKGTVAALPQSLHLISVTVLSGLCDIKLLHTNSETSEKIPIFQEPIKLEGGIKRFHAF
jgi:hypothetical protein